MKLTESSDYSPHSFNSDLKVLNTTLNTQEESGLNFNWVLSVFARRTPVMGIVFAGMTAVMGSLIVQQSREVIPIYEGSFRLLVEPVTAESRVAQLSLLSQAPEDITKQGRIDISLVDYESLIRVLTSPKLINPLLDKINTKYPNMTYNGLIGNLSTKWVTYEKDAKTEGTSLVRISYTNPDIDKIEFVLDVLSQGYTDYSIEERTANTRQGIELIESQLPSQAARVKLLEDRFQALRENYDLIDPNSQGIQMAIAHRNIKADRIKVESELNQKRAIARGRQSQFHQENYVYLLNTSKSAAAYTTLLKNLQQLNADIATASSRLNENSIPILILKEQREALIEQVRQEAEALVLDAQNEVEALQSKLETLVDEQRLIEEEINVWPSATRQYSELERELEFAIDLYKELLSKLESLKIDEAQIQSPWQIIDPPKILSNADGKPVSRAESDTKKKLALLVVVSTLLSIGVGFLVEISIPVFHTPEEVKSSIPLTLLGVVPLAPSLKEKKREPLKVSSLRWSRSSVERPVVTSQPEYSAPFIESFRSLYTNISLMGKSEAIRSLVVSSPSSGDGKSTVALNLAHTAASMGQRVLLVDANLRSPQLHDLMGLENVRGFSDIITEYLSLNEVIQTSPTQENLLFLSSGNLPPDPIRLLSSQKMPYLMGQLNGFFDLVIYDTPQLVGLADAHLIGNHADGMLLVVCLKNTNRSSLQKALEESNISGSSMLGVVANMAK